MAIPLLQIDAFTQQPYRGNPAAVCLLTEPLPDTQLQAIAAEMNLSETAFLLTDQTAWQLRWFTPACEVDLCGHATLAAAQALQEWGRAQRGQMLRFHTRSGLLQAKLSDRGIELDFPLQPPQGLETALDLAAGIGAPVVTSRTSELGYWLLELASVEQVRTLQPDQAAITQWPCQAVVVTAAAQAGDDCDFVSRFFAPRFGIPEDPVTGSAHCLLAPYWQAKLGRDRLQARQLSARGGELEVEVVGDRVFLRGYAVTVLRGELQ
ncbi:PhzF family phenazine biosynthesis protein [Synechococcus elongatus]|uniref:PhzF family phenazine biosynthesis protein n=1 Tax=Synechococcus elongatus TaxID=32046 RepID=UPI000F7E6C12|nr:PhzF family phenazine biosynthesis protein [Synechococcus elongatus]